MSFRPHTRWPVSDWEFREAVLRARAANDLPWGQRAEARRRIAADYGVSTRTVQRWTKYELHTVRVGKYEALFVIGSGVPVPVTRWERAA